MEGNGARRPVTTTVEEYRHRLRSLRTCWDEAARARWEADGHLPREVLGALGDMGLFRDRWAAGELAGLPLGLALVEELSLLSSGLGLAALTHSEVFLGLLHRLARTERQHRLLGDALDGRVIGCFAATEDHGGSDISALRTTARQTPDGWRVTGHKRFVSNAGRASHVLVLARMDTAADSGHLSLMLVPMRAPGVRLGAFHQKLGVRACDMADIDLDVEVGPDALLGAPGAAALYAARVLQLERLAIAAQMVAATRAALGLTIAFARRRIVHGERVMDKQVIRHRLADGTIRLWAVEALLAQVVAELRGGDPVGHKTAGLKLEATAMAGDVIDDCLQVFGGRGCTSRYPVEQWWRDVRVARIGGGSDEIMREIVGSRLDRSAGEFDEWLDRLELADDGALAAQVNG